MNVQTKKTILWIYAGIMFLAVLRFLQLSFVTPVFALFISGLGLFFSPYYVLKFAFAVDLGYESKLYAITTCLYISAACGNTVLSQFQSSGSTAVVAIVVGSLFGLSQICWIKRRETIQNMSELHRLSWWFAPLILYPFVLEQVLNLSTYQ